MVKQAHASQSHFQLVIKQCEQADDLVYCGKPKVFNTRYTDWAVCMEVGRALAADMPLAEGYFWDITCK
jgi:hypothetical protein